VLGTEYALDPDRDANWICGLIGSFTPAELLRAITEFFAEPTNVNGVVRVGTFCLWFLRRAERVPAETASNPTATKALPIPGTDPE
jgi:hypothetical protein